MILTINGQPQDVAPDATLHKTVAQFCKKPELVIAELNGTIIDRAAWDRARLNAGDRLELVSFVGGG